MPSLQWTCTHVRACALPSRLRQDKYLERYSVTLCTKFVDSERCTFLAFLLVNVASTIASAGILFLTVMRRTRIVGEFSDASFFFLGIYLDAGGSLTIQSLSNAHFTTWTSGCAPVCVSDWVKLLKISQLASPPAWMERSATFHGPQVMSISLLSEWIPRSHCL